MKKIIILALCVIAANSCDTLHKRMICTKKYFTYQDQYKLEIRKIEHEHAFTIVNDSIFFGDYNRGWINFRVGDMISKNAMDSIITIERQSEILELTEYGQSQMDKYYRYHCD